MICNYRQKKKNHKILDSQIFLEIPCQLDFGRVNLTERIWIKEQVVFAGIGKCKPKDLVHVTVGQYIGRNGHDLGLVGNRIILIHVILPIHEYINHLLARLLFFASGMNGFIDKENIIKIVQCVWGMGREKIFDGGTLESFLQVTNEIVVFPGDDQGFLFFVDDFYAEGHNRYCIIVETKYLMIIPYNELGKTKEILAGKKTVLVGGCFDLLHYGHLKFLKAAAGEGDFLIIALESDEFINKHKRKIPVHNQMERAEILSELNFVDLVILLPLFDDEKIYDDLVETIRPHTIAVTEGDRFMDKKKRQAEKFGADVKVVIPLIKNFSTRKIVSEF